MSRLRQVMAVALACAIMFSIIICGGQKNVYATNVESTNAQETTQAQSGNSGVDTGSKALAGDTNDIKITGVITQSAGPNGVAGIGFKAEVDSVYNPDVYTVKSVRPKMDTAGPFVVDNAMYAVALPKDNELHVDCGFVFNVKGNVSTAYYPIAFEVEYEKNGITYVVDKYVDIALYGIEETTAAPDDSAVSIPRIIVTGFETNPTKVMAGDEFELTVHLQNTSNKTAVSNIKVTMTSGEDVFLPSSGSSTQFIRSISCGATKDIVIKMKAQGNLEQKPYVLSVACEYEGEKNAQYTATENISIPVYQEAKAKITNVEVNPSSIETYSQANVMFSINNTGKSTLYNVQVYTDPENTFVSSEDSFVGNIAPGATGYADFMVTGVAPTMDDGNVKVIIAYEDAAGEPGNFETTVNISVYEPYFEEPIVDDFTDGDMIEPQKSFPWAMVIAGAVVAVVVIIVATKVVISKKRKREEDDLEDELS